MTTSFQNILMKLRTGGRVQFAVEARTIAGARQLDAEDPLRGLRDHYVLPTRASIRRRHLADDSNRSGNDSDNGDDGGSKPAVYFCGNSLGLQAKATRRYINAQLDTWAALGVQGHFRAMEDAPLVSWQDQAAVCAALMAPLVGAASPNEVVAMNTLTANLHLLLASFYRPTATRHKIIAEWKPFPSDSYALESQLRWHGHTAASSLVELQPDNDMYISTESVLATIDAHADDAALLLLPGIQYYSGQLFDVQTITAHARRAGLVVGWDLAHAVGNVELQLHDWDVDFAVWCTYKYLNAGPGAMAGAFVHAKHGQVTSKDDGSFAYHPRLAGWYGNDKAVRFNMTKTFQPTPGAQGFQLSNPSAIDMASLAASLSVFTEHTNIHQLRDKSLVLTAYAEALLNDVLQEAASSTHDKTAAPPFRMLTPANPTERGAQLSVLLRPGLLEVVAAAFDAEGVILDQRKPDVIRIAPVPMYNTFEEVWIVVDILRRVAV